MKKEKIYDFGMLGKWSETTLRLQIVVNSMLNTRIDGIESRYNSILKPINEEIYRIGYIKSKKHDIAMIYYYIGRLTKLNEQKTTLSKDYHNYLHQIAGICK